MPAMFVLVVFLCCATGVPASHLRAPSMSDIEDVGDNAIAVRSRFEACRSRGLSVVAGWSYIQVRCEIIKASSPGQESCLMCRSAQQAVPDARVQETKVRLESVKQFSAAASVLARDAFSVAQEQDSFCPGCAHSYDVVCPRVSCNPPRKI